MVQASMKVIFTGVWSGVGTDNNGRLEGRWRVRRSKASVQDFKQILGYSGLRASGVGKRKVNNSGSGGATN